MPDFNVLTRIEANTRTPPIKLSGPGKENAPPKPRSRTQRRGRGRTQRRGRGRTQRRGRGRGRN